MGTGCVCLGHALSHHVWWAGRVFLDHVLFALQKSCHIRLKREVAHKLAGLVPCLEIWFNSIRQGAKPRTPEQMQRRLWNIWPQTKDQRKAKFDQIKISTNVWNIWHRMRVSWSRSVPPWMFATNFLYCAHGATTIERQSGNDPAGRLRVPWPRPNRQKELQTSIHVCPGWLLCVWTQYIQAVWGKRILGERTIKS